MVWILLSGLVLYAPLQAQRFVSEARMEYAVVPMPAPGQEKVAEAYGNSTFTVWLKGNDMRTDFENPIRKQTVLFKIAEKKVTLLREAGNEKFQWNLEHSEWIKLQEKYRGAQWQEEPDVKEINGYLCRKAIIMLSDSSRIDLFYTRQVQPLNRSFDPLFELVPGIPVSYRLIHEGIPFEFSLQALQTLPVPSAVFDLPAAGIKIIKAPDREPENK